VEQRRIRWQDSRGGADLGDATTGAWRAAGVGVGMDLDLGLGLGSPVGSKTGSPVGFEVFSVF